MKILVVLPSGRTVDRTVIGQVKAQRYAEEFPTIQFLLYDPKEVS
jgi:hypothetical protein